MTIAIETASHYTFDTLQQAYDWANELINRGLRVQECAICEDRFARCRPRGKNSRIFKLFGVTWGVEKKCRSIEPDGKWRVEVDAPGTTYYKAGILTSHECQTRSARMSIWYSRFLPYAEAMVFCEQGFEQAGIDFNSINSYYGTVGGFYQLGMGDGYVALDGQPPYYRIEERDVELFEAIYNASMSLRSPGLPFDESFQPCYVYLAMHKPAMLLESFGREHWLYPHVREVCERIDKPVPEGF